jgi:hypothetical protein
VFHHQRVDFILRDAFGATTLSHVDYFSVGAGEVQNRLRD